MTNTADTYLEKLKAWSFPLCPLGEDHSDNQLNKICVDARCKRSDVLAAQCVICEEFNLHAQQGHLTKPLKLMLKDLLRSCAEGTGNTH